MQHIKGIEAFSDDRRTIITLGKFDGLHLGHQKLLECVNREKEVDMASVVFQFDMSRLYREQNKKSYMVMTSTERALQLEEKVDYLLECPFTEDIRTQEAELFLEKVLVERFHAAKIVVGEDFQFGFCQKGNVDMLKKYAKQYNYEVFAIKKETYKGREVSTTYIKEALSQGDLELANRLLGYPYRIAGRVEHGKKIGRTLGFPTLNIPIGEEKIIPNKGVYISKTWVGGQWYESITNIGTKPTVSEENTILAESYLFGLGKDVYGQEAVVELLQNCRTELHFHSLEELKKQIESDILIGKKFFSHI